MKSYRRVAYADRCQIYAWLQDNVSIPEISRRLGFHKTSIYREIRRNDGGLRYSADVAHGYARSRYSMCRKRYKVNQTITTMIEDKLQFGWSPEQIAGRLKFEKQAPLSHECIYQYVRRNKKALKSLMRKFCKTTTGRYLRRKNKRVEHYLTIRDRPKAIEKRSRIGDWERDAMLAKNRAPILVCVDRKTRLVRLRLAPDLKAETINNLTREMLAIGGYKIRSVTNDRGPEFRVPLEGVKTYYCDPMSPQQRGSVENTIGLLRQYIKNSTDLTTITPEKLKEVENKLNFRPRKSLKYMTPFEVFFKTKVALAN